MEKPESFYLYMFSGRCEFPNGSSFVTEMCRDAAGTYDTGFLKGEKYSAPDCRRDYTDWDIEEGSYSWVEIANDWSWVRSVALDRKIDTPALAFAFKKLKSNANGRVRYSTDYEVFTNDGKSIIIRKSDIEDQIGYRLSSWWKGK